MSDKKSPGPSTGGGIMGLLIRRPRWLRAICPSFITRLGWHFVDPDEWFNRNARANDPYPEIGEQSDYPARTDVLFGIVVPHNQHHKRYAAACRDLGAPYRFVDIISADWLDNVRAHPFDMLLVWPSVHLSVAKKMFDDRLRVIVEELRIPIYPGLKELDLYESKSRSAYCWRPTASRLPLTRVFYRLPEALEYASTVELPIVTKTDLGAGATAYASSANANLCCATSSGASARA
jgi:hypothetical protein